MAKPWHRWPTPLQSPDGGLRLAIYQTTGGLCAIRGPHCTRKATTLDHIIPPAEGGAWFDPTNLRPACPPCNTGRPLTRKTTTPPLTHPTSL